MRILTPSLAAALLAAPALTPLPASAQTEPETPEQSQSSEPVEASESPSPNALSAELNPAAVAEAGRRVARWQIDHFDNAASYGAHGYWTEKYTDWVWGAYYIGLFTFGAALEDPELLNEMRRIGNEVTNWSPGPRDRFADDWAVSYAYLGLYMIDEQPAMLQPTRDLFDRLMDMSWDESLEFKNRIEMRELAWCDALFMGPPTAAMLYAATGDEAYLDFADMLWWKTTDYLYDEEEHLYYRDSRYFDQTEPNGEKVFWARGNGWVVSGLVHMLEIIPADHENRERYETLFREMTARLIELPKEDGLWPTGLLDPERWDVEETSGTAFFTYGLAWGINAGILDEATYRPVVEAAWQALVNEVDANGRLSHVQPIGADPYDFNPEATMPYGVGAFLLAASEIYQMTLLDEARGPSRIELVNPEDSVRLNETVEIPWEATRIPADHEGGLVVRDDNTGSLLLNQPWDQDGDGQPDQLLIQTRFEPGEHKTVAIYLSAETPPAPASVVFGRAVPERLDDWAWENDRIAFRVYGPALEAANDAGSGIDVWVKSVPYPIIDKWYRMAEEDGQDYHSDRGEGLDYYKVGRSRGAGGLGIFAEDALFVSGHYAGAERLANGPIRVAFELTFEPWDTPLGPVSEVKRISLDRGSNLSRIESTFTLEDGDQSGDASLPVAVGLLTRDGEGDENSNGDHWLGYWEPALDDHGQTGVGLIFPDQQPEVATRTETRETGTGDQLGEEPNTHLLALVQATPGEPLVHYAGAGWTGSGQFPNAQAWFDHLAQKAEELAQPIVVGGE